MASRPQGKYQDGSDGVLRAGGLIRVSTKKQSSYGISADDQNRRINEWAARSGAEITKIYERVGSGGAKWAKRLDLQEIVKDTRDGLIDVVVGAQVDRISRDVPVFWRLYEELRDATVGLVVLGFGDMVYDTRTAMGRQMLGNYLHQADVEREFIASRAQEAHEARKLQGKDVGYRQPAVGFAGSGVIDPSESWLVERIFSEAHNGRSDREIAFGLAADGIVDRYGKEFTRQRIGDMLHQVRYAGYVRLGGKLIDAEWEPLVDRAMWQQIQDDRKRRRTRPAKGNGGRVAKKFLFSGGGPDLIDACDGHRFHARSDRGSYVCGAKDLGSARCSSPNLKQQQVDMVIARKLLEEYIDLEGSVEEFVERSRSVAEDTRSEIGYAERALATTESRLQTIKRLMQDEKLDPDDYAEQRQELLAEQDAAQAQLDQLHARVEAVERAQDDEGTRKRAVEWLMDFGETIRAGVANPDDIERMRVVAARLIDHVLVHPADWEPPDGLIDGDLTFGNYVLEIVWRDDELTSRPTLTALNTAGCAPTPCRRNRPARAALIRALESAR